MRMADVGEDKVESRDVVYELTGFGVVPYEGAVTA